MPLPPSAIRELSTEAVAALQRGDKIGAIKIVRESSHLGLKEAKDLVDAYLDQHPEVQRSMREASAGAGSRLLLWLLAIAAIVAIAYMVTR